MDETKASVCPCPLWYSILSSPRTYIHGVTLRTPLFTCVVRFLHVALCRVFCVSDEKKGDEGSLKLPLAAVAEISLQVPNGRTAPPFPFPLWVKRVSFESRLNELYTVTVGGTACPVLCWFVWFGERNWLLMTPNIVVLHIHHPTVQFLRAFISSLRKREEPLN